MNILDRLMNRVIFAANDCWNCTYAKSGSVTPRPIIAINSRRFYASRVMYELAYGKIPKGLIVRHTCDNSQCVNPAHLVLGTAKDNSEDMIKRGRATQGGNSNKPRPVRNKTTGEIFPSTRAAARACGIKSNIRIIRTIQGFQKTCGGFEWEYYNEV